MADKKFYTRSKTIDGVEYTAQFNGLSAALEAVDQSYIDGSSNISTGKLTKYIFENVIVEPKGLSADDFDDLESMNEVVKFGREVMQGKFRDGKDDSATKKASKG